MSPANGPRAEEGMMHMDSDRRHPSQVTDEYWVYADAPEADAAGSSRCGKWLVFVLPDQIDTRWAQIKEATTKGRLGITAKAATPGRTRSRPRGPSSSACIPATGRTEMMSAASCVA